MDPLPVGNQEIEVVPVLPVGNEELRRVEQNDSGKSCFSIGPRSDFSPINNDEWERVGRALGSNDVITELRFAGLNENEVTTEMLELFTKGFDRNSSIRSFEFARCLFNEGVIFHHLIPYLSKNDKLRHFSVQHCHFGPSLRGLNQLSIALEKCSTSLEEVHIGDNIVDDELSFQEVIGSLVCHPQLKSLTLEGTNLTKKDCKSLENLLKHPKSVLTTITLAQNSLDDEGVELIACGLGQNKSVVELILTCNSSITTKGWEALSNAFRSPHLQLRDVDLGANSIGSASVSTLLKGLVKQGLLQVLDLSYNPLACDGCLAIVKALRNPNFKLEVLHIQDCDIGDVGLYLISQGTGNLKYLSLEANPMISATGWGYFARAMKRAHFKLKHICCSRNNISDDGIIVLSEGLRYNDTLESVDLSGNRAVTSVGLVALSAALRNPRSKLQKLRLSDVEFTDEVVIAFSKSLIHNNTLLELSGFGCSSITAKGWDAVSSLVCDTTSINTTFSSNHTLQEFSWHFRVPSGISSSLELNRQSDKKSVALQKVFRCHFTGDYDLQPFACMSLAHLPLVAARIGAPLKNDKESLILRQSSLFYVIKSFPRLWIDSSERNARKPKTK